MTTASDSCIAPRCTARRELGALFCGTHLAAPTGTRGGWISAWRRAQRRGGGERPLDASVVARRLWVGAAPPFDRDLDFDVLFLCAAEIQPASIAFKRELVRVPLRDDVPNAYEIKRALIGGKQVAEALRRGQRVLVTCAMGRNRSALVAGLGIGLVTRMTTARIVELVRERRHPMALSNPHFVDVLQRALRR